MYNLCGIVCVDLYDNIGYNNNLLIHDKHDMKNFKEITMNSAIVMGGNTFRSLPNRLPLPGRTNIILSKSIEPIHSNMIVCKNFDELYKVIYKQKESTNVFIIGGESLYNEFQFQYDIIFLTRANIIAKNADSKFPSSYSTAYKISEVVDSWTHDINNDFCIDMQLFKYVKKAEDFNS